MTHFKISVLAFFLSCVLCHAQDWQPHYQQALQSYQSEQYANAIAQAEKAIQLASGDVKGQAFARQIFTASCLATGAYDKGLAQIGAEMENFKALANSDDHYIEALHKKGQLEMGAGKFEIAASSFRALGDLHAERSGKTSYEYLVALAEEADALMKAKNYAEAQQAYESSVAGFSAIPDAGEDYLFALFNSAFIDFTLSNKTAASKKLSELVSFMEKNGLNSYPEYNQAREMLSKINVSGDVASTGLVLPADEARRLFEKAFASQDQQPDQALADYKASVDLIIKHKLENNTTFSCYLNYARLLFAMGDFTQAQAMVTMAEKQAISLFGANSSGTGHVKILQGDLALRNGKIAGALTSYKEGVKLLRTENAVWIKQVRWVAEQLMAAKSADAIDVISIVLSDAALQSLDVSDKIIVHHLNGRAHLESRQAGKLITFLKPLMSSEKNSDLKQTYLLLSAQATEDNGDLAGAHRLLLDGISLAPSGPLAGELYFESARAYRQAGDYKNAEIHYQKALEHIVKSPFSENVLPLLFNSIATFYIQLGNYAAAEEFFLNLLKRSTGSPAFYNTVRQNLSALYQETGRYRDARRLLKEAIAEDERRGADDGDYAIALQNLAAVYQQLGRLDSAKLLYEKALLIDGKHSGEQTLSFATKLANLGTVYQESNDFAGARRMFERAMEIRKVLLSPDHPDYAYSQYTLANLLYRTQKPKEALPLFEAASSVYLRQVNDVFHALSDYERTAFYNRVSEVISTYQMFMLENISLREGMAASLLNFRLQTKALLLNSSLKVRNQILNSGDADLIRDFHVWQHTKEQLAYLFTLTKAERDQHASLIKEYADKANALEKSLSLKSEDFSETFTSATTDWRKVQAALKPGEGALEIVRVKLKDGDSVVYGALVIKPGISEPLFRVMADGNVLEQKVFRGYLNRIQYDLEDGTSYKMFWEKIEPMLKDVHTVYVSPDGVYTKINCAALYDVDAKQYLIDRKKIMLVSNIQDLISRPAAKNITPRALLVGNPDYRMSARSLSDAPNSIGEDGNLFSRVFNGSFVDLPGTAKEVTTIAGILKEKKWSVSTLLRADALESKIKEADGVTVLHIATHGFFVAPRNEHAKQVFSTDLKDIDNNSMLRSGLILAGAEKHLVEVVSGQPKSASEDGILTAYEVMNLNLDSTDLVVMSACETGKGDVKNGEGVYGLQRAFLLAGASHVLMSLWKVDDEATQRLMAEFYAQWLSGKDKLQAFQDAQLIMKQHLPNPRQWGAFVMMGR